MEIFAKDKELRKALADESYGKRRFGADMYKKLRLRVQALQAASSLADFWPPKSGPERCHELAGNLAGVFTVDLTQPYRLLFRPVEESQPADRSNEQQRWELITAVELVGIEDTHG